MERLYNKEKKQTYLLKNHWFHWFHFIFIFHSLATSQNMANIDSRRTPEELPLVPTPNSAMYRVFLSLSWRRRPNVISHNRKPVPLLWMWESPGGEYRNEIDHIIVNRIFCLRAVAVPMSIQDRTSPPSHKVLVAQREVAKFKIGVSKLI